MKKIILHVGPHKTGTTSIQNALLENEEILNSKGIGTFKNTRLNGEISANCNVLSLSFVRPELINRARFLNNIPPPSENVRNEQFVLLQGEIAKYERLIVSSEGFSFLRTVQEKELLQSFLSRLIVEIRILLTIRNKREWKKSYLGHLRRSAEGLFEKIHQVPEASRVSSNWYFNQNELIAFWKDLGTLKLLDYEKAMKKEGNIIPCFLRAIDEKPGEYKIDIFKNISPSILSSLKSDVMSSQFYKIIKRILKYK